MSLTATRPGSMLSSLYEADETAWLEIMARLAAERRFDEMDHEHLSEFLTDMALRERREVVSRMIVLLAHWLKWDHQPKKRSQSWRNTIREQRRELRMLLQSGTLRNHAEELLAEAYREARGDAAEETGLGLGRFPLGSAMSVDDLLTRRLDGEPS